MPNENEIPGLHDLARDANPPKHLEDRVVSALRSRNLIGQRVNLYRWWVAAAAAVVIFGAGLATGAQIQKPQPTFILLLRGASESLASEPQRVAEYRAWAQHLRAQGFGIAGTKLGTTGETMRPDGVAPYAAQEGSGIAGFFLIRARNLEEARHIAQTCPHLRRGGQIEVRPIEGT
jgi:hypothetical protein